MTRARARKSTNVAAPAPAEPRTAESPATVVAILVLAALAAVLVAIVSGPHRIGAFDVESDFYGGYAPAASGMLHGQLSSPDGRLPAVFGFVGPLYPALLALGGLVGGDLFGVAEALSVVMTLVTVLAWFLLLRRRVSATVGCAAVVLLATNPLLLRYGYSATTDATALAFQSVAVLLLFTGEGVLAAAGAGVITGLAILTRYNSVYLVPAAVLALALGGTPHATRGRALLAYMLGTMALVLPWQLYSRAHGGEMQFHQLLAFDVYANARGLSWDTFLQQVWPGFEHAPLSVLTRDPAAVARRLWFNAGDHLRRDGALLLGWPLAAAAAAAPVLAWFDRRLLRLAPLALSGALAYAALLPAAHNERYSLMVLPYHALLAAATVGARPWRGTTGTGVMLLRLALVTALALPAARASVRLQTHVLEQQPTETLACAERLRALARAGDRVIARKPNLAFHAGVGAVYFPPLDSLAALARYARENGARWLYVSPAEVQLRPQLGYLLDTTAVIPGLTLRAFARVPTTVDGLAWQRVAALYELGPTFGEPPEGFADVRVRDVHLLRGLAATIPDARLQLRLARAEMLVMNLDGAQSAWRAALRIDPPGVGAWLAGFHGDTLRAVGQGLP